jgi:hypothetical protein
VSPSFLDQPGGVQVKGRVVGHRINIAKTSPHPNIGAARRASTSQRRKTL